MQTKIEPLSFSTQETVITQLPDLPGQVVEVRRLIFGVQSFTLATAVAVRLDHNVSLAITLGVNVDLATNWAAFDVAMSGGGPPLLDVVFDVPYELIGPQRIDVVSSAGTVIGALQILYTSRSEPNRVLWNALRARTSFERG